MALRKRLHNDCGDIYFNAAIGTEHVAHPCWVKPNLVIVKRRRVKQPKWFVIKVALIPSITQLILRNFDEEKYGFVVNGSYAVILLMSVPNPCGLGCRNTKVSCLGHLVGWRVNFAWHGSQQILASFWGNAAFISGLLMVFTTHAVNFKVDKWPSTLEDPWFKLSNRMPKKILHYLASLPLGHLCPATLLLTL